MKRSFIAAIPIVFVAVACLAEISGEHPVATPAYEAPSANLMSAQAASDGHGFLVARVDYSHNRAPRYGPRMYATRVTETGQVLDPLGIRIPTFSSVLYRVNVVYLGDSYLICWSEGDISAPGVMGVRISSDGTLLDSTPRVFADHGSILGSGTASNGNRAVIVYTGPAGSLMTVVLDRDANVVAGPKPLTSPAGPSNETAMIASNGHGFLVIHTTENAARTTALDANGTVIATTVAPAPNFFLRYGFLASDGDSYVAILAEQKGCCETGYTSRHFGPKGEVLEAWPIYTANWDWIISLAYSGGSYLAMEWRGLQYGIPDTIGFRKLTNSGQPSADYAPFASADNNRSGLLVSNGSSAFACYHLPLMGSLIDVQTLTASKPSLIGVAATTQRLPDTATSGANMAIVWNERDGVYAGRLTFDGQLLDGRGIRIGASRFYTKPRIVFDGTNYIIGWIDDAYQEGIRLARLSPVSGVVLDPGGVTLTVIGCSRGDALTLSRGAQATLVAWADCNHVSAVTIREDLTHGAPLDITPSHEWGYGPNTGAVAAAWNGSEWLVSWETWGFPPELPALTQINAARLSPQLTLLNQPISVSNTYSDQGPLVSSDGNGFLVVWSHYATDYGDPGVVVARRIAADGSPQSPADGVLIGQGSAKSIAWDGVQYEVAFSSAHDTSTLYVTHVASHGSIESLLPLAVVNDHSQPDASLIVTGPGRVAVAYTRIDSRPEYGDAERLFIAEPHPERRRAAR